MPTQGFVQVPPDSTGKKVDTVVTATAAQHRHVMTLGDPTTDAALASVTTANGVQVDVTRVQGGISGTISLPTGAATEATLATRLTESDFDSKAGSLTETAPATDTASSGLNGRLQRVAQRLSNLIALLPAALGAGGGLKVDGSGTALPVSAASLPLPTGASTAALQTQPGVDIGDVTINNASGASAVNIQDGGNSITVDAASLPLPTGAATLAEQQTQTTSLQLIDDAVKTDDAAFTPAADKVLMIGAEADSTSPDSVDEGDAGALRMTLSRMLLTAQVCDVATLSNVASAATSATVLAANVLRVGCLIQNDDANALLIKYGATASATSYTVSIPGGGYWEMPRPVYRGILDGIWLADGSGSARVTELT